MSWNQVQHKNVRFQLFPAGKINAAACHNLQIREFKGILNLLGFIGITHRKKKTYGI